MYSKFSKDFYVIICLYIDNMLIFITNMIGKMKTKRCLTYIFKMKDLSKVDIILVIKVKKYSNGYAPNQSHHIEKILDKFKHLNIKKANTLFDSIMKLNDYYDKTVSQLEYVSSSGSLMYVMHCTRPDIAFVIYKLSRYTNKLNMNHWKAIAWVFGYLKRTIDLGLLNSSFLAVLEGYCDTSSITSLSNNKFDILGISKNKHTFLILPWNHNFFL